MENENINIPAVETPAPPVEPAPPIEPLAEPVAPVAASALTPEAQLPAAASTEATAGKSETVAPQTAASEEPKIPPTPFDKGGAITALLMKAKEKIQFRKRAKLEKIMALAQGREKITNDDAQKLLRVSDATATRYLSELVKQGRLRRVGPAKRPYYEI